MPIFLSVSGTIRFLIYSQCVLLPTWRNCLFIGINEYNFLSVCDIAFKQFILINSHFYAAKYLYLYFKLFFLFPDHCLEVTRLLIALRCRRLPRKAYHHYRRHWGARYHPNILAETDSLAKALLSVLLAVWTRKDIPKATMIAAALWRNTLGYLQA